MIHQRSQACLTQLLLLVLLSQVGIQQGLLTGLSLGCLNMVLFSAYAASLYYGATRVAAGTMSGGDVLAVMMAALLGAYSLGQAAPLLQYFLAGRAAAGRLTAVDKIQPSIDVDAPGQQLDDVAGELRLQDVCFVYPCLQVQVLHGLNLHIPAGKQGMSQGVGCMRGVSASLQAATNCWQQYALRQLQLHCQMRCAACGFQKDTCTCTTCRLASRATLQAAAKPSVP